MTDEDIPAVQHVATISWHATYEGIFPIDVQNNFLKVAYNTETLIKRMEKTHFFVAVVAGEVVGFANYSQAKDGKMELIAIYLLPEFQGAGIGSALLQSALQGLGPIREIYVLVEKDNAIGMNFYKAKGFEFVEEFDETFNGHVLKTVRMVKKITR